METYFDAVAAHYAAQYAAASPGGYALRTRRQRVLDLLDQPGGKVLDVGCGPGALAGALLDLGYAFWGVDASPDMIAQGRQGVGQADRAHFAIGDATHLPFPDGCFDAVICTGVLDRLPGYTVALTEMLRVVKRHGTLMLTLPNLLSPYAAWKTFIFYPAVAWLRPMYDRLRGRPQPPSVLSTFVKLHTARAATAWLAAHGADVTDLVYFHFNVFLSPLDELFPQRTLAVTAKLEWLRFGKLQWLGAGFLLKAIKR